MSCTEDVFAIPAYAPVSLTAREPGIHELVAELRELTALVRILVDRQAVSAPAVRQDPRTYQTIDKPL